MGSRTKGLGLTAAAGVLTVVSVGLAAPAFAGPAVDGVSTTLVGSGSDTTHAVMHRLDAVYAGAPGCVVLAAVGTPQPLDGNCVSPTPALVTAVNPDHDNVVEKYPLGSGNGINQLCQQGLANVLTVDFARSSRGPSGSDCNGLQFVSFARDGISWFHFSQVGGVNTPSNAVTNLTQDQIRKIFVTGEINNWSQVGGTNAPIVIYAAQAGSGTRSTFDGLIGGSSIAQIPALSQATHVITENNAQPLIDNGDAANAIFYESYGRYQQSSPGNSTQTVGAADGLGNIDGITPDATTIGNSTFPFGRSLYNVLRYPSEATKRYLDPVDGFLCRTDIDTVASAVSGRKLRAEIEASIAAEGFVPLAKGTVGGGRTGQSYCRLSMPNPDVSPASVGFTVNATSSAHSAVHITFSEQVVGVSAASLVLANGGGTAVPASVSCTNASGQGVACDSGPVLSADITNAGPLANSTAFHVTTTVAITDRAGN
ncbi:MAG: substrate-binding domain-containing protein, partial [Actinomycetes bacterium]